MFFEVIFSQIKENQLDCESYKKETKICPISLIILRRPCGKVMEVEKSDGLNLG